MWRNIAKYKHTKFTHFSLSRSWDVEICQLQLISGHILRTIMAHATQAGCLNSSNKLNSPLRPGIFNMGMAKYSSLTGDIWMCHNHKRSLPKSDSSIWQKISQSPFRKSDALCLLRINYLTLAGRYHPQNMVLWIIDMCQLQCSMNEISCNLVYVQTIW